MLTREEMLRGVVRINNERIDSQAPAKKKPAKVQGDGSGGEDKRAGGSVPHAITNTSSVPGSEESLSEFIARRTRVLLGKVEEVQDRIAFLEAEVRGLEQEEDRWLQELEELGLLSSSLAKKAEQLEMPLESEDTGRTVATSSPDEESTRSITSKDM